MEKERKKRQKKNKRGKYFCNISGSQSPVRDVAEALYSAMDFEKREGQKALLLAMAERMDIAYASSKRRQEDALNGIDTDISIRSQDIFVSETPVGTGKSYVLLMLSFISWYLYGKKSVISTQTKILQNQMFSKDIPMLKKLLAKAATDTGLIDPSAVSEWRYRVVKGRSNYLCPNELDKYRKLTNNCGDILVKTPGTQIPTVVTNTKLVSICNAVNEIRRDIDRGEGIVFDDDPIYPLVVASKANCMKGREICPYHPTGCSYNTTINADADLIITNHRLVSNFIKSDSSTEEEDSLPEDDFSDEEVKDGKSEKKKKKAPVINAENYFFDEAHHLMGYQSGEDVSDSVLTENIAMYLSTPLPYSADKKTVSAIVEKRDRLWTMWGELLYGIGRDIEKSCADSENTKGNGRIFGSDPRDFAETGYKPEFLNSQSLNKFFAEIYEILDSIRKLAANITEDCRGILLNDTEMERGLWDKIAENIKEGRINVDTPNLTVNEDGIIWNTYGVRSFEEDMANAIPSSEFVSFISGTVLIDGKADVFAAETGISHIDTILKVRSPFAHKNINLWVPRGDQMNMFSKKDGGKGHFESMCGFCLKYVPPYVEYNFGGVLILCTSVVRMKLLAEKLAPAVEAAGRHVLVQGSMPRAKLVKVFLNNPSSVLIATNSFREGFDAPKEKLTWVILDKLPFPNPSDRGFSARMDMLKKAGLINDKKSHTLDLMLFDLVQSFGRLERSVADWGTLTILDPRFYWLTKMGENDPLNTFRKCMSGTIEDITPFSWKSSRLIDRMIKPDVWMEIAKRTQQDAEIDCEDLL